MDVDDDKLNDKEVQAIRVPCRGLGCFFYYACPNSSARLNFT